MGLIGRIHARYVFGRRIARLAELVAAKLGANESVLDIGAGSGELAQLIMRLRPDVQIRGVDVLVREKIAIPIDAFDGLHLPFPDASFDSAMLIDVVHHAQDPKALLKEAARVVRKQVIVKDHLREGLFGQSTLHFMDKVGNVRFGVDIPARYFSRAEWRSALDDLNIRASDWNERPGIYPAPLSWIFDRSLHVFAVLEPTSG